MKVEFNKPGAMDPLIGNCYLTENCSTNEELEEFKKKVNIILLLLGSLYSADTHSYCTMNTGETFASHTIYLGGDDRISKPVNIKLLNYYQIFDKAKQLIEQHIRLSTLRK